MERTVTLHVGTEPPQYDDKVVLWVRRHGEHEHRLRLGRFRNGKWCVENAENVEVLFWFFAPEE